MANSGQNSSAILSSAVGDSTGVMIEQGLAVFYNLSAQFLMVVQPQNGTLKKLGVDTWLQDPIAALKSNWTQTIHAYPGYTACAIVGLIFIIVMPLLGSILCCCATCRCKKGKRCRMKSKHYACKLCINNTIMGLLLTFMLGGIICGFLSSEVLHRKVVFVDQNGQTNTDRFLNSLSYFDQFLQNYIQSLNSEIVDGISNGILRIKAIFSGSGARVSQCVARLVSCDHFLATNEDLQVQLQAVSRYLTTYLNATTVVRGLNASKSNWDSSIRTAAAQLLSIAGNCQSAHDPACSNLVSFLNNPSSDSNILRSSDIPVTTFSKDLTSTNSILDSLTNMNASARFQGMVAVVQRRMQPQIDTLVEKVLREIKKFREEHWNSINDFLQRIGVLRSTNMTSVAPTVYTVSNYVYGVSLAAFSIMLGTLLLLTIGLCCGICGKSIQRSKDCCRRPRGSPWLLCGFVCLFLFAVPLMAACLVLFVIGGPTYTEICRPVLNNDYDQLDQLADLFFPNLRAVSDDPNVNAVSDYVEQCRRDRTLFDIFGLERRFKVGDIFSLLRNNTVVELSSASLSVYDVSLNLSQFININDINKYKDSAINELGTMQRSAAATFGLLSSKSLFKYDLKQLVNLADKFVALLGNGTVESNEAQLQTASIATVINESFSLRLAVGDMLSGLSDENTSLDTTIVLAQQFSRDAATCTNRLSGTAGSDVLLTCAMDLVSTTKDQVTILFAEKYKELTSQLGRCHPLYVQYQSALEMACVQLMRPLNSVWWSLGWALSVYVPTLVIAVWLYGLYQKTRDYMPVRIDELNELDRYLEEADAPLPTPPNGAHHGNMQLLDPHLQPHSGGRRSTGNRNRRS